MQEFTKWSKYVAHRQAQIEAGQRALLVVPECDATQDQLIPVLLGQEQVSALLVNLIVKDNLINVSPLYKHTESQQAPSRHLYHVQASQAKQYLGQNHNLLIYRAQNEFNVSAFAALCGCIIGGGLVVLIVPREGPITNKLDDEYFDINHWGQQVDAQSRGYGVTQQLSISWFKLWWQRLWQQHDGVAVLFEQAQANANKSKLLANNKPSTKAAMSLTQAQGEFVNKVKGLALAKHGVLWLSGPRGRGKSTALAAAMTSLEASNIGHVITAAASQKATSVMRLNANNKKYLAVDQLLLQALPASTLVIVEEASSMPLGLLRQLLAMYPKLILVSTQDGYEGTGQGLETKLPKVLEQLDRPLLRIGFTDPLRWLQDDPLEALINASFLPRCLADIAPALGNVITVNDFTYRQLRGKDLFYEPNLLAQVFTLLQQAHYQTTPQDLRLLMDHPQMYIHCWFNKQEQVLGVITTLREGGLNEHLACAIARGERRVKGHLLPQVLAQQAGIAPLAIMTYSRIQRIVVHPQVQRQGLGSLFLNQLLQKYSIKSSGYDWIATSYGAEMDLVAFWQKNQFKPAWAGLRMDASTGLPSMQMLLPVSQQAQKRMSLITQHWFYYHNLLKRIWPKGSTLGVLEATQIAYQGRPYAWLAEIRHQVTTAQGNIYSVIPYLVQDLLSNPLLTSQQTQWLQSYLGSKLSHKQLSLMTRQLLQLDIGDEQLP